MMKTVRIAHIHKILFVMLLAAAVLLHCAGDKASWAQAPAPSPTPQPAGTQLDQKLVNAIRSGKILLNFDSIDIKAITKVMAELSKKNIVLEKSVSGNLSILSSRRVSIKEAWDLYVSALEASGFGVVDYGKYVKVMPIADARKEDTRYVGMKIPKLRQGYIVAIVLMNNSDAEIMANTLRPMVTAGSGVINAYTPSNAVVIADSAGNVSRLTQIIKHLDSNYRGATLRVFQPKYIRVKELSTALQPLFAAGQGQTADKQVRINAYEPTNSLLVVATERDFVQIESIMAEIDTEDRIIKPEARSFKVHYLQYADAEECAKVIANMMEERKRIVEEVKKEQAGTAESKEKETFISSKVSFDKATNSLVFYVTDKEYDELKKMIGFLDAERKQVLISAIIAEVDVKKVLEIGSKWHIVTDKGVASFQGGLSLDGIYNMLSSGGFVAGGVSTQGVSIDVGGKTLFFPNVFAAITALETNNGFNLLSAPRILSQDHKEAKINVGQIIPYATGVKYDTNGQPIITYDYKDVGLTLTVTPHISQGENVRLDINQVIKDVTDYLKPNTGSISYVVPIVSNREVKTFITLKNHQTIIIGGLISNKTIEVIKSIPFLSKLPILGKMFFQDTSKTHEKSTLFVFITPHIINSPKELQEITDRYGRVLHIDEAQNKKAPFIINEDKEEHH